jgi:transcriptional regulator with XRE-family HTH domain
MAREEWDTLAKRVKGRRLLLKFSQEQLAEFAGLGQSDISKIERGDSQQTAKIAQLARALRCDPLWLATGDGDPRPVATALPQSQETLLEKYGRTLVDLEAIPPGRRHRILDEITDEADRAREAAAHLGAWPEATPAPTSAPLDPDATAARLIAEGQRLDEIARHKRTGRRLK